MKETTKKQLKSKTMFRYWNQCMSASGNSADVSPNRSSDASPSFEAQEFKIEVKWINNGGII